ncbi:MAG: DUF2442 domain-containing protein [Oscillospiraceae bacterium]|jgi:hypothetical protein|nr:DUF2442 domain-containing protein [Oscillospiraceae bacterium]
MIGNYPKLKEAKAENDYCLVFSFSNGEKKFYDFTPNLSHPYYKVLSDQSLFRSFTVNDGEIEWVTGQDFCPHTLYDKSVSYTK